MLRRLSKKEAWQPLVRRNCVCSSPPPTPRCKGVLPTYQVISEKMGGNRGRGGQFKGLTVSTLFQVFMLLIRGELVLKVFRNLF